MKKVLPWCLLIIILSLIGLWTYNMFNSKNYQIKFDVDGGSRVEAITIKEDEVISSLPITSKENYEFQGWYLNDELFDFTTPITKDITLVAKWLKKDNEEYTLTFDSLGGTEVASVKVFKNTILENYPEPVKEGYAFVGWYYHNKPFDFTTSITKNMTFIAKWQKA